MLLYLFYLLTLFFLSKANYFTSNGEKVAFIVAGVIETFLFLVSILGYV